MCLTVPKKVIAVSDSVIKVMPVNAKKSEDVGSIMKVKKGDWVLTQNGIIINRITSRQASEVCKLFNK